MKPLQTEDWGVNQKNKKNPKRTKKNETDAKISRFSRHFSPVSIIIFWHKLMKPLYCEEDVRAWWACMWERLSDLCFALHMMHGIRHLVQIISLGPFHYSGEYLCLSSTLCFLHPNCCACACAYVTTDRCVSSFLWWNTITVRTRLERLLLRRRLLLFLERPECRLLLYADSTVSKPHLCLPSSVPADFCSSTMSTASFFSIIIAWLLWDRWCWWWWFV